MLNIVYLDGKMLNPGDLSWSTLNALGHVQIYDISSLEEGIARSQEADIIITNKFVLSADIINQLPQLKCICVTATGYNNIDLIAAKQRGIVVCNVSGYSTMSTAQHAISLLLELSNRCGFYNNAVQKGQWTQSGLVTYNPFPALELSGLTMGVLGAGAIGLQTAKIARAIGMRTIGYKRSQTSGTIDGVEMVNLETLFKKSDVLSLHAPLNADSNHIINARTLNIMKPTSLIINTARGGLINEPDLKAALLEQKIAGAALDVLSAEPPTMDHPLLNIPNCILTSHIAWASKAARSRLLESTVQNIAAFINGTPTNQVAQ